MKFFGKYIVTVFIAASFVLSPFSAFAAETVDETAETVEEIEQTDEETDEYHESYEYAAMVSYVMEMIMEDYTGGEITYEQLYEGALRGMSDSLDEYSHYMSYAEFEAFNNVVNQTDLLFGIEFYLDDEGNARISRIDGESSAVDAGLKNEDIIITANGKDLKGMALNEIITQMNNFTGAHASLTFKRGEELLNVQLEKRVLTLDSVIVQKISDVFEDVKADEFSDVRRVTINTIGDDTSDELEKAIAQMQKEGVKKLIIDLRFNGGGYLDGAINILNQIAPKGVVLTSVDKKGNEISYESALEKAPFEDMVILTNEYTASAAEIITVCMQDNGYTVIGQKSFGKGIMQEARNVGTGVLSFTTREYFGPKGTKVNGYGINPNIYVALPDFIDIENPGRDNDILLIKGILKYCGYEVGDENTSVYDSKTKAAVRELKTALGLSRDDVIDAEFKEVLNVFYLNAQYSFDLTLETALEYYSEG